MAVKHNCLLVIVLCSNICCLTACGQKGPLIIPTAELNPMITDQPALSSLQTKNINQSDTMVSDQPEAGETEQDKKKSTPAPSRGTKTKPRTRY